MQKSSFIISALAICLSLASCSSTPKPKELVAKAYTATYEASPSGCGYSSWQRISDGQGHFRNEMLKDDGTTITTIVNSPNKKSFILEPKYKTYTVRQMAPDDGSASEGLDQTNLDPPKPPCWIYKESTKTESYKTQLWRQMLVGSSVTSTIDMWYGEDTGCPVVIKMTSIDTDTNKPQEITFTLREYEQETPDESNFAPPDDYKER